MLSAIGRLLCRPDGDGNGIVVEVQYDEKLLVFRLALRSHYVQSIHGSVVDLGSRV